MHDIVCKYHTDAQAVLQRVRASAMLQINDSVRARLMTDACCVSQVLLRGISSTTGGRDHLWLAIYAKSQDKLDGQAGCRHRVVRSALYPCSRAHGCGDRHAGSQSL